ncbi:LysM peptidoglycan-binding domain-containing protein [Brevibacillus borstelensis]|uniref:LysM peptidoglycan-binding domain-containing protein n=1 Tax=Brevibacillus borstelensis TaxID=45462 RepID=UPI0030C2A261
MKWPYNPERIEFDSSKIIVEHKYPHRQGAETEDMGRNSVRVDVSGIFLLEPDVPSPAPEILMNNLWFLQETGAIGKVFGSELGTAVEGRLFRIVNLKGRREEGTVGDIPYSFTFLEHYQPQASKQEEASNGAAASSSGGGGSGSSKTTKEAAPQSRDVVYIVKSGDTLWGLAKHYYGDPLKFKKIMADNRVDVSDMKPGRKLTIKDVKNRV